MSVEYTLYLREKPRLDFVERTCKRYGGRLCSAATGTFEEVEDAPAPC